MQRSVFDIADDLLKLSDQSSLESLKLQKLTFYAYGWYAHLTGRPLFDQQFYAMQRGPVVGELLTAHSGEKHCDKSMLLRGKRVLEERAVPSDPFYDDVLQAVWSYYGQFSSFELVDMTHEEEVWVSAWSSRPLSSNRGDLPASKIITYFASKREIPADLKSKMPDSELIQATPDEFVRLESLPKTRFVALSDRFRELSLI